MKASSIFLGGTVIVVYALALVVAGDAPPNTPCSSDPCHAKARCYVNNGTGYRCQCPTGFLGDGVEDCVLSEKRKKHYLFAGQSNMEGNVDADRFQDLMHFLEDYRYHIGENQGKWRDDIVSILQRDDAETPVEVLEEEAAYLLSLQYYGLLDPLREPFFDVECTFYKGYHDGTALETWALESPLSPYANCGVPFGPELMFGHTMRELQRSTNTGSLEPLSIVKVAAGGTELAEHWARGGVFWDQLAEKIQDIDSTQDSWDGFVWWQGENDAFGTDGATYLEDLRTFIADVRQEMFQADKGYAAPEDIPVVIIQIGHWAQQQWTGAEIAQAQKDFVDDDPNAVLIPTNELSWYYHHDETTQLMVGDQIALKMRRAGMLKRKPQNGS